MFRCLVEDGRGFHHFNHERRAPPRQVIGGPDAAEQAVDNADMGPSGRHIGAHLRQNGDEGVLPQKR